MQDYKDELATYVELISDDFMSTFTVIDNNTLQNMIGDNEFDELRGVIKNYITKEVYFHKVLDMPPRSMYIITTNKL